MKNFNLKIGEIEIEVLKFKIEETEIVVKCKNKIEMPTEIKTPRELFLFLKKYKDEIHFTPQLNHQKEFDDLNSITKVNAMPKYNIKIKKSCFSYLPIDSENLITTKENSEVAA